MSRLLACWSFSRGRGGRTLKWVLAGLVLGAVVYWLKFSPIAVESLRLRRGAVIAEVMGTGTLEARIATTISPKISGRISKVLVDQGDLVRRGALLVQLDDEELLQQVAIADANVEASQAAIVRLKTDQERANAVYEQAQRSNARTRELRKKNAATLEEEERSTESLAVATADIARAEAAITEGRKVLVAAEKTSAYHRARLMDTRIDAPFDGMIVLRHREAGDVTAPGGAVLTLVSTETLWINAWVDEAEMAKLAEGQPVRVVFRSRPDCSIPGRVHRLGKQVDRETREFVVDVEVGEPQRNWAVGQRAEVFIEVARRKNVLLVPSRSLIRTPDGEGVFINENGYARWRPLELGLRGQDSLEVKRGLDGSEVVVIPPDGAGASLDGKKVQPL